MENIFGNKRIVVTRHVGDLNTITLEDGTVVRRQESVMCGVDLGVVKAAPYDSHFLFRHAFRNTEGRRVGWTLWCTCGSPAGVVGFDAYKNDASPQGQMLICLHHSGSVTGQAGKHADGSS